MALILCFHNDSTGTERVGHYDVEILIGDGTARGSRVIERGRVINHQRADGWAALVSQYLGERVLQEFGAETETHP